MDVAAALREIAERYPEGIRGSCSMLGPCD
jgi:hypothetical protein